MLGRLILALFAAGVLGGCVGQVPKSYTWRVVDCTYLRDGIDVIAKCELEGTAELGSPELGNIID